MVIHYDDGSYARGAIHSIDGRRLRLTVTGLDRPVEFLLDRGRWTSSSGAVVTLQSATQLRSSCKTFTEDWVETQQMCSMGGDCFVRRASQAHRGEPS